MAQMVKDLPAVWEAWVGKIPWRRAWQPSPVFLPGESPWTEEPDGLQSVGSQSWTGLSNFDFHTIKDLILLNFKMTDEPAYSMLKKSGELGEIVNTSHNKIKV